jgi:uncharacterized protein YjcR
VSTASTKYATAADLAALYGVPVGTIYRWASTHHWDRTDPQRRPVKYNRDHADQTYHQHHQLTG